MLPWLVALLAGCTGRTSRVEDVPETYRQPRAVVPPVEDLHRYGLEGVRVGQWATYQEPRRKVTVAAVAREGEAMWFEEIDEGEPRQVSARRVAPGGAVEKAFYIEIYKDGSRTVATPQPLIQGIEPESSGFREVRREPHQERVKVGGRELEARGERVRFEDLDGRFFDEVLLGSPEVPPVYAPTKAGGLIRRSGREGETRLLSFGTDAKPQLALPK